MRITIVTDAWHGQTNGVVRTLEHTKHELERSGHHVSIIHPGLYRTVPLPSYPEIQIAINPWRVGEMIAETQPDSLHIAVEGSLGFATKLWADRHQFAYTTSYHTRFPEYLEAHHGLGLGMGYRLLRWFHNKSSAIMVNTETMRMHLAARRFDRLVLWGRGVDTTLFTPNGPKNSIMRDLRGPILLNVGRVSTEKNLPAFYQMPFAGTKVQVGDGPMLTVYRERYPDVVFLGAMHGTALAECYRSADVFVFPSLTDTYGLVMLEAMASGVPVAAYPVAGPVDVVTDRIDGALNDDLAEAVSRARACARDDILGSARRRSWSHCTAQFIENLVLCVPRS